MSKITDYRIVISEAASTNELRAASFLRENIKLVCGKKLEIVRDSSKPTPLEIVVGKTAREEADGMDFVRSRTGVWEYVMRSCGERLYLTGLGCPPETPPPYTSAYRKLDDGAVGTVLAAYHFVEDILHYDFVYSVYDEFPETPELEMPRDYSYSFTREHFRRQRPIPMEGTAMYFLQCAERLDWNIQCVIFRTKEGKLVVIDGGHPEETERFLASLETLSGGKKPHVHAWLFSHLHGDHFGVYETLCRNEELRSRVQVDHFYCNLMTEDFYATQSCEPRRDLLPIRELLVNSEQTVGAKVHVVHAGDVIEVDELHFEVLHAPQEEFASKMNMNDSSVVYKLTHTDSGQTILFLGDAEWVCNNDLVENCADKLKSDVVQVGHHGCGNVSRRCYELIDADAYIWPTGQRFWYSESGEALNSHNTGVIRTRFYIRELGAKPENIYVNIDNILSTPLPFPIH